MIGLLTAEYAHRVVKVKELRKTQNLLTYNKD